ncbi:MAG: HNH endonuclease [Myxococcota bacterium]
MSEGNEGRDWLAAKVARIEAELRDAARSEGRLRLELGECLDAIARTRAHHALGFSSIEAYAKERCGFGKSKVGELRKTAERLRDLPRLREALVRGTLRFSMVELVARHATQANEPFLTALAHRSTVPRMRALLREKKKAAKKTRRIDRLVDAEVAWLYEQTRLFVEAHCGSKANDAVWEALLAEATTELLPTLHDPPAPVEPCEATPAEPPSARATGSSATASGAADTASPRRPDTAHGPPDPNEPMELDRRCAAIVRELDLRGLRIADLSLDLEHYRGYGRRKVEYAEEVLGMSLSSLNEKQRLARHLPRLPEIQLALEAGRIGLQAACLIVRVATQQTAAAWADRAARRTFKHLKQEVDFVERVARLSGGVSAGPPTPEQMEHMDEVESGVLTGQISGLAAAPQEDDPTAVRPQKMGRTRLSFRMSGDLAAEFRRLERAWHDAGQPDGTFVAFFCRCFWRAWGHIFDDEPVEYEEIYQRERYQCASPTCERRDMTPHHLVFRSQGGGDEPDNVVGLCSCCHLQLIHTEGSVKAEAPATHMSWKTPVLEVEGREVVWRRSRG